jgi:hypothetical protein
MRGIFDGYIWAQWVAIFTLLILLTFELFFFDTFTVKVTILLVEWLTEKWKLVISGTRYKRRDRFDSIDLPVRKVQSIPGLLGNWGLKFSSKGIDIISQSLIRKQSCL